MNIKNKIHNKIYGIDSLYYFAETNENYDCEYMEIIDQIEDIKGKFDREEVEYNNRDITVRVNDIVLEFLGKSEGFNWFRDDRALFKVGFKGIESNRGLHNIRIQLLGNGIYSFGLNDMLSLVNDGLLKDLTTGKFPITRVDLNCFIQADLSFIDKSMFSSRKRTYTTISEIANANGLETLYVGKEPFKLRLYDKMKELQKSPKKQLMYEYFINNGFDNEEDIKVFNVEFQMNRRHLQQFNIDNVEDMLKNAKRLFEFAMDDIRLIDINSVSKSVLEHNKHEALTHPIWEEIKNNFSLDGFLQDPLPLERLKRKVSIYDSQKFEDEYIALLRKAYTNQITLDEDYIIELSNKAKESLRKHKSSAEYRQRFTLVEIEHPNGTKEELRLLEDGKLIKPLQTQTVSTLQDYDLMLYLDQVTETQHISEHHFHIFQVAQKEAIKRGLMPTVNLSEVADECPNF